eukprot:scaffold1277_cov253-Pinguiococcus_pyrenoidosus.AAC.59
MAAAAAAAVAATPRLADRPRSQRTIATPSEATTPLATPLLRLGTRRETPSETRPRARTARARMLSRETTLAGSIPTGASVGVRGVRLVRLVQ